MSLLSTGIDKVTGVSCTVYAADIIEKSVSWAVWVAVSLFPLSLGYESVQSLSIFEATFRSVYFLYLRDLGFGFIYGVIGAGLFKGYFCS